MIPGQGSATAKLYSMLDSDVTALYSMAAIGLTLLWADISAQLSALSACFIMNVKNEGFLNVAIPKKLHG